MAINNPSQYDCDKMKPGDIVYITKRNFLYKLYRKYFMKDKIKILVRRDWVKEKPDYDEYYQEDCILIFAYELQCKQEYKDEVACKISFKNLNKLVLLKNLKVGLYNIQLMFNNICITLPTNVVENALNKNKYLLKSIDNNQLIYEQLKFQKYKGETFRKIVKNRNIKEWTFNYCFLCGKPLTFCFEDDNIILKNYCECDNTTINMDKISYDEFAIWYNSQIDKKILQKYNNFWFNKEYLNDK